MKFSEVQPDETERKLIDALGQICIKPEAREFSTAQWTREIKSEIAKLGKSLLYNVYAHSADNVDDGEWLFDVCWLKYEENCLKTTALVVESEWNPKGVDDDFQKLVVARSLYRMMIFTVTHEERRDLAIAQLIKHAEKYEFSSQFDRYLMCSWNSSEWIFDCRVYGVAG